MNEMRLGASRVTFATSAEPTVSNCSALAWHCLRKASRLLSSEPEPTAASVIDSARSGAFRPICSDE